MDVSKLNLYQGDTLNNGQYALGLPDVTVTGSSGNTVQGSLIWDGSTNTAHFVATGGLLAPDTYAVRLASRSDGFTDTAANGGGLLLSNDTEGGNNYYLTTFHVAAPTVPVLSLPDFARGPGQSVVQVTTPAHAAGQYGVGHRHA